MESSDLGISPPPGGYSIDIISDSASPRFICLDRKPTNKAIKNYVRPIFQTVYLYVLGEVWLHMPTNLPSHPPVYMPSNNKLSGRLFLGEIHVAMRGRE